jgi:nucleotide-binding universal stress UspA family protein
MVTIRKILVPVDFSKAAGDAARYASALSARFSAEITLLHVAPPIAFDFAMTQPTQRRYQDLAEHRNQTLQQAFESFPGGLELRGDVRRELAEGDPADEIVRRAHEGGYDLIVMPCRGMGPIRRWLTIGSVTTKVLHAAECPVLAGLDFTERYDPFRVEHVLCAVDLGPQSSRVLQWGAGLADQYGSRLSVVHAAPGVGEAANDFFDETWRATLCNRLRAKIAELAENSGARGDIIVEAGDPHKIVSDTASRIDADVVLIGRGMSDDLLGRLRAHAYEIIRRSPCPVLSV